jgi:hypothetical protein
MFSTIRDMPVRSGLRVMEGPFWAVHQRVGGEERQPIGGARADRLPARGVQGAGGLLKEADWLPVPVARLRL